MTYWPISSPSIFAATKHTRPEQTRVSHDGLEDGGPNAQIEDQMRTQGEAAVKEGDETPSQQPRASDALTEDDIHGEIIAIRVTRSGHLFATLTRSTLTIWQTKARL
jgi:hypothetical protein